MVRSPDTSTVVFLLASALFLYFNLFVPPFTPFFAEIDQSVFLHNAMRMLQGEMIYRDFFHFILPGTELLYVLLFKLVGVRAWIPGVMLILVGLSLSWLGIAISRKIVTGTFVFLPSALFLLFPFRHVLDATHNWYSVLAVITAMALLIEKRTVQRLAVAGALCGVATCFTQNRGMVALLGLLAFILLEQRAREYDRAWLLRRSAAAVGGFMAVALPLASYLAWRVGLSQFLECVLFFPLRYYPTPEYNTWRVYMAFPPPLFPWHAAPGALAWYFMHGLLPLVYLLFLARYWQEGRHRLMEPWDRLMLLTVMGLALLAGILFAPAASRLFAVSLPGLILFVWFLHSLRRYRRMAAALLWVFALTFWVGSPIKLQMRSRASLDLPTGRTAFLDRVYYEKYRWALEHTEPSDYFLAAAWTDMYFWLKLRNPSQVPFVTPDDYTRPEQVENLIQDLEKHRVRYVLWEVYLDAPYFASDPATDHLWPLRSYLRRHYRVAKTFPDGAQVWERVSQAAHTSSIP
jgi:hypothetical protein